MALAPRRTILALGALLALAALAAVLGRPLLDWLEGREGAGTLMLSGNIEAHESVLGFKTVQSRIVELPFNEGQWVKQGTVVARADDSDYAQQVAVAEAGLATRGVDATRVTRYAAARDGKHQNHLHFHCDDCGQVYCLDTPPPPPPELPAGFQLQRAELDLHGQCDRCNSGKA